MKKLVYIAILLPFVLSSCFKKIEGIDELNTNIYDREYAGDQWFQIEEATEFINEVGQTKVRIDILVPEESTPGLKPSFFYYSVDVNNEDLGVQSASKKEEGHYEIELIVDTDPSSNYCVMLGVWIEEDEEAINHFSECVMTN
ncbi:MAG: hypothetical protein MI810_14930 [Flavobacteriales bacterium]|nr:hypothetical protein [Flavobacteriales bacterium]